MRPSTGLRSGAVFTLFVLSFVSPAAAGSDLPPVKVSDANSVAQCATPGRLMAFIRARNPNYEEKFEPVATEYMRHGEQLGLRWDYGFFQMLVETGFLSFTGDVKPEQNNFAGLGTTGGGVKGEKFKDVSSGARAHLEHLAMYSGQKIENPVAERTKNIQEWEVLTKWQKTIKGPMTFAQVAKQWAPNTRGYASDIQAVADRFMNGLCKDADPYPERVAEARGAKTDPAAVKVADKPADVAAPPSEPFTSVTAVSSAVSGSATVPSMTIGDELAKRANEHARAAGSGKSALGAVTVSTLPSAPAVEGTAAASEVKSPEFKILNGAPAVAPAAVAEVAADVKPAAAAKTGEANVEVAALSSMGKPGTKPEVKSDADANAGKAAKCKVFTASYGGDSAVIVKATVDKIVNYTVLHVNDGAEKREADAYIAAYAKGGETVGSEFKNQDQAMDKAFELCPEG